MKIRTLCVSTVVLSLAVGICMAAAGAKGNDQQKPLREERPNRQNAFAVMDANKDGAVTRDEFGKRALEMFTAMDENKDGSVSTAEREKYVKEEQAKAEKLRQETFARLDKNADGFITQDELPEKGAARMLDRLDANKDGKISAEEMNAMPAREQGAAGKDEFARFDTDKNGTITLDEVNKQLDERFDKLDADHDKKLTQEELGKQTANRRERPAAAK